MQFAKARQLLPACGWIRHSIQPRPGAFNSALQTHQAVLLKRLDPVKIEHIPFDKQLIRPAPTQARTSNQPVKESTQPPQSVQIEPAVPASQPRNSPISRFRPDLQAGSVDLR